MQKTTLDDGKKLNTVLTPQKKNVKCTNMKFERVETDNDIKNGYEKMLKKVPISNITYDDT